MTESLDNAGQEIAQDEWRIETYYFGNAVYPSDATYRINGERLQARVEKALPLSGTGADGQFLADTSEVSDFLAQYQDCYFLVADSHEVHGGGRTEPYLWLMGWQELTAPEELQQYEEDKADGDLITKPSAPESVA